MPICNKCGSDQAIKAGLVGRSMQRYRCKECGGSSPGRAERLRVNRITDQTGYCIDMVQYPVF